MNDESRNDLPIGIFDSGVGGLTVLQAIRDALPEENLVYLGDTARLPYGTKSPASIARYAVQAATKLCEQGIKLLVVACNTASAVALDEHRQRLAPLPVIGVVEQGASAAVAARPGGEHLVLATEATVRLGAYRNAIVARDAQATVCEQACEMLVSLAEEGWSDGDIAHAIVRRYLDEASLGQPDTINPGCRGRAPRGQGPWRIAAAGDRRRNPLRARWRTIPRQGPDVQGCRTRRPLIAVLR